MQLRPEDEFPHQPDGVDEAPWKDTYWFVARDPVKDVAVHAHLTLSANRLPPARATVLVKDGAREALGLLRTDATRTHGNTVGNDLLQVDVLDPQWDDRKRIRLSARLEEVDVQLDLAGRFPAADINVLCPGAMPDRSGGPVGPAAEGVLRHLEHAMSFTGFLKWTAGEATSIEGFAIRDRSWGWRKNQEMFRYGWEGFFGHGTDYSIGVGCYRANDQPGGHDARVSAWISSADGVVACSDADLRLDGTGRPTSLSLTSTSGRTITGITRRHGMTAHLPFHDPDPEGNSLMIVQSEHHLELSDQDGAPIQGMYTTARPMLSHVLEGAKFFTQAG
jgi:hypothetical protein